tara:strand:+ start:4456 stop:6264 length:1809 start_codon:yes stop_codon:yes gene_type:complete
MFKNLVKKIKGAAKKIAPYAGVIAGAFGAGPWMSAGIGALGGGLGTGNAKGAVLGGLGGFGAGTMWGGQAGSPGGNRLFGNPLNIFNKDKAFFNPDKVAKFSDLVMGNRFPVNPDANLIGPPEMSTGLGRFKDALMMEKNPLTGNKLDPKSMYRFLPAALGGTALAYGLGAFDEEPVPEDEIPKEYVYDAATDPLKNVNKRFQDYYQGITQIPSSSIYGYLQSIGALKEGGVPRGYSAGGSITPEMDIPGQFLLNSSAKTPLSVLEAADGMNTSVEDEIIEKYQNGEISEEQYLQMREGTNDGRLREAIVAHHSGKISDEEFIQITGVNPPQGDMNIFGLDFNQTLDKIIRKKDPKFGEGISGLESYVDTGEGEGIDQGLGAAKDVLQMGAEEAIKELGTTGRSIGPAGASTVSDDGKRMLDLTKGQQEAVKDGATQVEMTDNQEVFYSSPSDEGKTFGNGEFYYDDPNLIRFIQRKADQNGTTYQEELFKFVEEVESFYRNKKANGGLASFNYGGQIMGPGSGREDVISGKIVDKNTGQTSDMLVSNNEHIIPEYALYAMGGGDTKKGHDMMDSLRKKTKPMAQKMGYDFSGAEDGSVMYG